LPASGEGTILFTITPYYVFTVISKAVCIFLIIVALTHIFFFGLVPCLRRNAHLNYLKLREPRQKYPICSNVLSILR